MVIVREHFFSVPYSNHTCQIRAEMQLKVMLLKTVMAYPLKSISISFYYAYSNEYFKGLQLFVLIVSF